MEYKEHVKGADQCSPWHHFLRAQDGQSARCKKCSTVIKCAGGSTKGLHVHLKSVHGVTLLKRGSEDTSGPSAGPERQGAKTSVEKKQTSLLEFALRGQTSLKMRLARMVALDGLSFLVLANSRDIRDGLLALKYPSVPSSPTTIKQHVLEYADEVRSLCKTEIKGLKERGTKFGLSHDEWTSVRARRYLNVNVHAPSGSFKSCSFWNLGLVRIVGSLPAEQCRELIKARLSSFGLDYAVDIAGQTTDGASVMVKLGKLCPSVLHQLCLSHGAHLAVLDTVYQKTGEEEPTMRP
jgi:hypothetical protein